MSNWLDELQQCDVFTAIATDGFFRDARCKLQTQEAIRLQMPIIVMLRKGTQIPDGWFEGAQNIKYGEWDNSDELGKLAMVLIKEVATSG